MKILLLSLAIILTNRTFSQDRKIMLSVSSDTLSVLLDDDNEEKVIHIKASNISSNDEFHISVLFWKDEMKWHRTFVLNNEEGMEITEIPEKGKHGIYCLKLNVLIPLLQKGDLYSLYTVSLPKDPKLAMVVKVPRVLVCKLEID